MHKNPRELIQKKRCAHALFMVEYLPRSRGRLRSTKGAEPLRDRVSYGEDGSTRRIRFMARSLNVVMRLIVIPE